MMMVVLLLFLNLQDLPLTLSCTDEEVSSRFPNGFVSEHSVGTENLGMDFRASTRRRKDDRFHHSAGEINTEVDFES